MTDSNKDWRVELMGILNKYLHGSEREICFLDVAELLEKTIMTKRKVGSNIVSDLEKAKQQLKALADAIHYPKCWDTVCYPTLLDAIQEIGCNSCVGSNPIVKDCMNCGNRYSCDKIDTTDISKCWVSEDD